MNQNEKSTPGRKRTQEGVAGTPFPTGRSRRAPELCPESRLEGRAVLPNSGPGPRAPGAALRVAKTAGCGAAPEPSPRRPAGPEAKGPEGRRKGGKRRELTSRRGRHRGHRAAGARPAGPSGARLPVHPRSRGAPRGQLWAVAAHRSRRNRSSPPTPQFQPRLSVAE